MRADPVCTGKNSVTFPPAQHLLVGTGSIPISMQHSLGTPPHHTQRHTHIHRNPLAKNTTHFTLKDKPRRKCSSVHGIALHSQHDQKHEFHAPRDRQGDIWCHLFSSGLTQPTFIKHRGRWAHTQRWRQTCGGVCVLRADPPLGIN